MNSASDWQDHPSLQKLSAEHAVSAAKLQVLALAPIMERLGPKWPRLSELVHKLFETAIAKAQGPQDSFVKLDELCYAAIFRGLSVDAADRICVGIARQVCRALFGEEVDEVAVRNVVAKIALPVDFDIAASPSMLDQAIERNGKERIITEREPSARSHAGAGTASVSSAVQRVGAAHAILAKVGLKMRFFPVWDLKQGASNTLFLVAMSGSMDPVQAIERSERGAKRAHESVELAIAMLDAAAAYAERAADTKRLCAIGTEVSYDILSSAPGRSRYVKAMRGAVEGLATPLILKIARIPKGTLAARIGELATLLHLPNVRVLLEFESVAAIPSFEFRIQASGIGSAMPQSGDDEQIEQSVKHAVHGAAQHKLFVFLDELNSASSLDRARHCGVRFGVGSALDIRSYSGIEAVPQFPIPCRAAAAGAWMT